MSFIPFEGGKARLTSKYGERTLNGKTAMHWGVDLVGVSSKYIVAFCGGKVLRSRIVTDKSSSTWEMGNYICIQGDDGRQYYYMHMSQRIAQVGDVVTAGQRIGIEGSTGYSTGSHLHFEVRNPDGTKGINAADVLGIPNAVGTYESEFGIRNSECGINREATAKSYIKKIVDKVGYDEPTAVIAALEKVEHPFVDEVWRKIWEKMK
jgi:murein DD-endopeptidase MepM/ murein hydrolase activator NlpD